MIDQPRWATVVSGSTENLGTRSYRKSRHPAENLICSRTRPAGPTNPAPSRRSPSSSTSSTPSSSSEDVLDSELLFGAFKKTMRTEKRSRTRSVSSGSSGSAKRFKWGVKPFKVTCNKCGNKISKNYYDTTESSASESSADDESDDLSEDQDDGSACGGLTYRVADQDDADDESDAATSPTTPTTAPSFFSRFG